VIATLAASFSVTDLSEEEIGTILAYMSSSDDSVRRGGWAGPRVRTGLTVPTSPQGLSYYLGQQVVSSRARLAWTTSGHSAVDVNLYGYTVRQPMRKAKVLTRL
jgi:hypothetical protein